MSKPRYKWWGYIKAVIRDYPRLKALNDDLHSQSITVSYDSITTDCNAFRTIENLSIKELPKTQKIEYSAVQRAIDISKTYCDGDERLKLMNLVFWRRSHTLQGAALKCNISYGLAKKWHNQFVRLVAQCYGLLEENEKCSLKSQKNHLD